MHRRVGVAQREGDAHGNDHAHSDGDQARDGQVDANLQLVEPAQHKNGVDEHEQVAGHHFYSIKEDGVGADVAEAAAGVDIELDALVGGIEGDLEHPRLPAQGDVVRMLDLNSNALRKNGQ